MYVYVYMYTHTWYIYISALYCVCLREYKKDKTQELTEKDIETEGKRRWLGKKKYGRERERSSQRHTGDSQTEI